MHALATATLLSLLLSVSILSACGRPNDATPKVEGFITADDGVKLYYVSKGSGRDVVVAPMALFLEEHLAPLANGRRIVFYDPRNRGRSDAADLSTISLDRQIEDLEDLREALGLEKMALIGWSGLGMEMAAYTIRHPDRVTRLIQISPVPPAESIMTAAGDTRADKVDQEAVAALDARARAGEFEDDPAEYCRLDRALTLPANFVDTSLISEVADACVYENEWPKNFWPYIGALLASFQGYDWRNDLETLEVPRLIIHGREDGIPLAGAEAWAAGYPTARLLIVSPAGHFPYIEQKDLVIDAADAFLGGKWPKGAQLLPATAEAP